MKSKVLYCINIVIVMILVSLAGILALYMPESLAPDENMRNDIPFWIFQHGQLPVGNEPELTDNIWRFSYGFLPYLPSLIAIPFMHLFHWFSPTEYSLFIATRFISLLSLFVTTIVCLKIGRMYFKRDASVYLFTLLINAIPQNIFISSYHNNDSFALLSCCLVLFFLLKGTKDHWDTYSTVGLGISFSLCLLTYYNTLGWILLSIFYCLYMCIRDDTVVSKVSFILNRVAVISALVVVIAGWFFIRNAYLHNGDFLGIESQRNCAYLASVSGLHTYIPITVQSQDVSIWYMLVDLNWITTTFKSFIGVFGYMNIPMPQYIYFVYLLIYVIGSISYLFYCYSSKKIAIPLILFCLIVIPVLLSIYRSYTYDLQAQGRYLYPALPAIALVITKGFEYIDYKLNCFMQNYGVYKTLFQRVNLSSMLSLVLLFLLLNAFFVVMFPKLVMLN